MKDTNDILVSQSLKALSFLVPLLGGDVVVGTNRKAYFHDGNFKVCLMPNLHSQSQEVTSFKLQSTFMHEHFSFK